MRRLALVISCGALWLILAAVPALADGGPHVMTDNNGSLGINADGCAGCHRAHTAQGPFLLNAADETALCKTCHGTAVTGSRVDVMDGVQYALAGRAGPSGGTLLGALRGGGFDQARLDTGNESRLAYLRSATAVSFKPKIGVGAAEDVTSSHLAMSENGLTNPGVAWGNGLAGSGTGDATFELTCASCHNPHGNGQYRILNTTRENADIDDAWIVNIRASYDVAVAAVVGPPAIPAFLADNIYTVTSHGLMPGDKIVIAGSTDSALNSTWFVKTVGSGAAGQESSATNNFTISATLGGATVNIASGTGGTVERLSGVPVTDATLPALGDTRNYTVMQVKSPTGSATVNGPESDYLLYASQVATAAISGTFNTIPGNYTATGGDYFARLVPWNPAVNNVCSATTFPLDPGCATAPSAPNGRPTTFSGQITQWCASCHTRYFANNNPTVTATPNGATGASWQYQRPGESLFMFQHRTVSGRDCLTCHVSHGSNAAMTGGALTNYSGTYTYPNGTASASSRLLKVDNRGTCQSCHDPTGTITAGTYIGPAPAVP